MHLQLETDIHASVQSFNAHLFQLTVDRFKSMNEQLNQAKVIFTSPPFV
jgi:hypothetical protein